MTETVSHYRMYTEAHKKYQASEKGRAARAKYQASDKGRAARKRAQAKRKAKVAEALRLLEDREAIEEATSTHD